MDQPKTTETNNFEIDSWAIVEVFGHDKIAGKVRSGLIGPTALLRVDVPELTYTGWAYDGGQRVERELHVPAFTKYFGAGAVFSLTPVTEDVARRVAIEIRAVPHSVAGPMIQQLAPGSPHEDRDGDEEDCEDLYEESPFR